MCPSVHACVRAVELVVRIILSGCSANNIAGVPRHGSLFLGHALFILVSANSLIFSFLFFPLFLLLSVLTIVEPV